MGHKCALLEIVGHRRRTDAGEPFIHISAKRGYMLENPMYPLYAARYGVGIISRKGSARRILRDYTPRNLKRTIRAEGKLRLPGGAPLKGKDGSWK